MSRHKSAQKLLHLEFLRICAIILVIYNHAGTFVIPGDADFSLTRWVVYLGSTTCKVAVPLFFMISGALLLGRDEDLKTLYKKRIWRYAVVLCLFIVLQHTWDIVKGGCSVTMPAFAAKVAKGVLLGNGGDAWVVWFLYAYILLLVFLPFLRRLAGGMRNADFAYLLLICCAVEVLLKTPFFLRTNYIHFVVQHTPFMPLSKFVPFTAGYGAFYMLMGFWAERFLSAKMHLPVFRWGMAGVSVVCLFVSTVVLTLVQNQQLMGCFLPLPTIAVYLWAKYIFEQISLPAWAGRALCLMGGAVFVVMLTENIWRKLVAHYILPQLYNPEASWLIHLSHVFLTFMFACLMSMILKQIPCVKRYV